jgi:hypothetical protein
LDIHGSFIKTMTIKSWNPLRIEARNWLEIFKKVPNLETLDLDIWGLSITDWHECKILQNLRNLTLDLENSDIKEFLNYIGPNTLRKLEIKSYLDNFEELINRQLNVKDLTIRGRNFTQLFNDHRLDSFSE